MDRFQDCHPVAGAKDDRRDAFVMTDALRTDLPLFHRVQLDNPFIMRIRELSRAEEDMGTTAGSTSPTGTRPPANSRTRHLAPSYKTELLKQG